MVLSIVTTSVQFFAVVVTIVLYDNNLLQAIFNFLQLLSLLLCVS